jgi:uncharacterized RDD family membrane protein YckC
VWKPWEEGEAILSTERHRETPEGVDLSLRVAGPPVRLLAWFIDQVILLVVGTLSAVAVPILGDFGFGLWALLAFCLSWFYFVLFELLRDGSTPGKRALGLQVIHQDGTAIGPTASLLRNFLRVADFLPFAYGLGLVSMFASRDFRRLGDHAAGTLVIYRATALEEELWPVEESFPPPPGLADATRRALVELGERQGRLNPERVEEMTDLLFPLTGATGEEGRHRVLGMGRAVLEGRGVGP